MAAVRQYVDAFNSGDEQAMAAACADPMQILDGMSPHVWQGPTAAQDWWRDASAEAEHAGAVFTVALRNVGGEWRLTA
jgi:ketosteroid isomerase-like protein